ncbi:MAG: diaminopimelate epimerase [Candidatus Omnitrophica bacterium]|nr:diaminopimelate epimerase [Candidatus Omnitrophota bacterium]
MKKIKFHKMVGAGNDFVVIDHRKNALRNVKDLTREICDPHYGIGADGLVLLEDSRKADLRMRIINADGSEAEMCGNATRCVALYAEAQMGKGKKLSIETRAGEIRTEILGSRRVRSNFTALRDYRTRSKIRVLGKEFSYYSVDTGVPHAVIFVKNLAKFPVVEVGRAVRYHKQFWPRGQNCDFVQIKNAHTLLIRTYERGVEDETLACGTGVVASAVVSVVEGFCKTPVKLITRSGEALIVNFKMDRCCIQNVTLEGPAKFICEGTFLSK